MARSVARSAAAAGLLWACMAQAQTQPQTQDSGTVSGFRLPPASAPAPAPAAGPVDTDHPVAAPSRPAPEPAASPSSAAPSPQIVLPPATAAHSPQRPEQRRASAPIDPAAPLPEALPAPATQPAVTVATPTESAPSAEAPAAAAPVPSGNGWLALAAGVAAFLAALAWLLRRRRKPASPEAEVSWPAEAEPESPAPASTPASAPATLTPVGQKRPAAISSDPLQFALEPQSLRLSFAFATLSYRLALVNRSDTAFTALRIYGDMTSGHASQAVWQQLSLDGVPLDRKHEVAALAPGETLSLTGELRLPLGEVLPLRAGAALMFAPLARFLIEGDRQGGGGLAGTHIFTLGQPSERSGDTMQPFRLDQGPQLFGQVVHREIDVARWLQLDEARRAG